MKKIPDRWEIYKPVGHVVRGTRFLPFKVPLNQQLSKYLPNGVDPFTPEDLVNLVKAQDHNLGLVIDLTNTKKYYNKENIEKHNIQYEKIFTEGHVVPSRNVKARFFEVVDTFLKANPDGSALIGVHCTHGLNRTGYLVCRYMIDKLNREPEDSIIAFNDARGHKMERQNYLDDLRFVKTENETVDDPSEQQKLSPHVTDSNSSNHKAYDNYSSNHNMTNNYSSNHNMTNNCSSNHNTYDSIFNNEDRNSHINRAYWHGDSQFNPDRHYDNRPEQSHNWRRQRQNYSYSQSQSGDGSDRRWDHHSPPSSYGYRQFGSPQGSGSPFGSPYFSRPSYGLGPQFGSSSSSRSYQDNRNHPYNCYPGHRRYNDRNNQNEPYHQQSSDYHQQDQHNWQNYDQKPRDQ